MITGNGNQLRSIGLADTPTLYQALVLAKDEKLQPHEREYLLVEINRALKELRGTAQWLAAELRSMDELRG